MEYKLSYVSVGPLAGSCALLLGRGLRRTRSSESRNLGRTLIFQRLGYRQLKFRVKNSDGRRPPISTRGPSSG